MNQIKIGLICVFVLFACGGREETDKEKTETVHIEDWTEALKAFRIQKDNDFAVAPQSPFASDQLNFKGLNYFPPDWAFRVNVYLKGAQHSKDTTEIMDTKGMKRKMLNKGVLQFNVFNVTCNLPAMVFIEDTSHFFVMFRDKTSGKETYGGGRYIELPVFKDSWMLDFNYAYNPFCHYNHEFSCPVVPENCYLNIEIKAGEKKYP